MTFSRGDVVSFETAVGDAPGEVMDYMEDGVVVSPQEFYVDPSDLYTRYDVNDDSFKLDVRPDISVFTNVIGMDGATVAVKPVGPIKVPEPYVTKWGEVWYEE